MGPVKNTQGLGLPAEIDDLTREQRVVLSRITTRFREGATVQVLSGPHETGKSTVGQLVGRCLDQNVVAVTIGKDAEQPPALKRLMQEAYGSYPYFLVAILKQIGFTAHGEETDLVEQLVEQLRGIRDSEKRLLIIIDDAQDMTPGVWKRLQSWLDFQDRGVRMIQVLLVGSPMVKKMLGEPILRGWRRWVTGTYDLHLLKLGTAAEEARLALKRCCDRLSKKAQTEEPIVPPHLSWFAAQKIVREAGGRPGRMNELIRRTLAASIRQGGVNITRRFLAQADALRSPAMQAHNLKKVSKPADSGAEERGCAGSDSSGPGARKFPYPLAGLRYALGALLVLFVVGAGWGISSWISATRTESSEVVELGESEVPEIGGPAIEEPVADQAGASDADPWGASPAAETHTASAPEVPSTDSVDQFLNADIKAPEAATTSATDDLWSPVNAVAKSGVTSSSIEAQLDSMSPSLPTTDLDKEETFAALPAALDSGMLPLQSEPPAAPVAELPKEEVATPPAAAPAPEIVSTAPIIGGGVIPPAVPPVIEEDKPTQVAKEEPKREIVAPRLEPPKKPVSSRESSTRSKPRLSKKTLDALSRLEKKLQ